MSDIQDQIAKELGKDPVPAAQPTPTDVYNYLVSKGVSDAHAKGMLASIDAESKFNPAAHELGKPEDQGGIGLFQHTADRRTALETAVPDYKKNWQGQIDFAMTEPQTQKYFASDFATPEDAAKGFTNIFEKPANTAVKATQRAANIPSVEGAAATVAPSSLQDQIAQEIANSKKVSNIPEAGNYTPPVSQAEGPFPGSVAMLAGAKSGLDAMGVSYLMNKLGLGPDPQDQAKIAAAQKDSPAADIAGTGAGILGQSVLLGPLGRAIEGVPALAKVPTVAKALGMAGEGAAQGGIYEGTNDPNATAGSVAKAALTGAVVSPVVGAGLAVAKNISRSLTNWATRTSTPEIADYIHTELGPTLTKKSLISKNTAVMADTEAKLKNVLSDLDNQGKTVNMRQVTNTPDLLKDATSLDNVGERAQATKIINRLADYEKKGNIPLTEANQLKQDLYKISNWNTQSAKPSLGAFQKKVALTIKDAIETASGSDEVKNLNQKWGTGIDLNDALTPPSNPNRLRVYGEAATALTQPHTIPAIAAERALTSIPGATLLGSTIPKISPSIQSLLQTLVPQMLKSKQP